MDISELEAQLTEEPNVTKVVPNVYLELATKSIMHIQSLISPDSSNSVPINQLQCQYILDKLCETLNNAKECICGSSLQDVPRSDCIFQNLAQMAMEVEKLVGDCCDAQWIQAAMIVANAKEHFASLAFKLRLYRQLLQSIFEKKETTMLTKLQNPKWSHDIQKAEVSIMDQKVQEDRKRLLSRLRQVGSSESENLIKRLEIFSIPGGFSQLNKSFDLDPWKVEWKSIQRSQCSQIGKGSFADVHKVEWRGKHFAEKSFPFPENETFRKEVSFLAGLSHPNILPLFGYATGSRYCSIVMELMDEDLHSLMRKRLGPETSLDPPFELLEAIDIMLQVAEGMKYLHQNKVVHRDLRAGNILVKCNDGHVYVKVADFGVSKTIDSRCTDSNQTTDVGTTKWMAPELFSEESHDAGQSVSRESDLSLNYPLNVDIYSFGMVCYEILTGCIPFVKCNNMRDLRKRIKDGLRPEIPDHCPERLATLMKACYHSNPAIRPSFRKICVELRHLMWSLMLNNLELGDSTARWSNLPGAEQLGQGSLPHSPVGRGSPLISPLVVDLDRSHQQVPEDVNRKFHEFNLQGIHMKGKTQFEEQVNDLKSFSEAITPVHDLHPECTSTNPDLVVIFFHGISYGKNDEWKETWTSTTSDGNRVCWPQEWLPADLATENVNNVRILSLSYDSALLGNNEHVRHIAKNLIQSLVSKSEYEPLWEAPIVLVGYSIGGLVLKSLVLEVGKWVNARNGHPLCKQVQRSCKKFSENLKRTIFYSVPHTGGGKDCKQFFVYQSQQCNGASKKQNTKSGILKSFEGFNIDNIDLSADFENAVDPALIICAFGEGQPVRRGGSVLVPYASAAQHARRNYYQIADATHITICKPSSQQAINYSKLKDVLAVIAKGTQRRTTPPSTHDLSQLRFLNTPSEISSSSNTTPSLDNDLR